MSIEENMTSLIIDRLKTEIENLFIEGLKRKGFEFENRIELENFIKSNCRCEDITDIKQRTYFVNNIPFFLHCYEINMNLTPTFNDKGEIKLSYNYGSYSFL